MKTRTQPQRRTESNEGRRRKRILARDGYRCVYCSAGFPPELLTLDHVEPRIKGGDHSDGNLVACCRDCNLAKGGMPAWRFLATRSDLRANFLAHATAVWPRLRKAVMEAATE